MKNFILCILFIGLQVNCQKSKKQEDSTSSFPSRFVIVNGIAATEAAFNEVAATFGKTTNGDVAVGIGFILSYFKISPEKASVELRKFLSLSEKFDLPIVVQLDGEQWWGNRPDLWNWWDKDKPGYNPENKKNVEWIGWIPDSAVKIGWRNWGSQLRVLPMPNLMSPEYRQACHKEMKHLIPIVMKWWQDLPEEKKYLLVGIKLGWESAIGVNNWYYPNGNSYLDKLESEDPNYGLESDSIPSRGVQTIGYAAVSTLGLATSGNLKENDVTQVIHLHLKDLCQLAAELGVPRDLLFTHGGGWSEGETLYSAAVNEFSCPGWSFYTHAYNPVNDHTAMKALEQSDAPYWAAVEWLYMGENTEEEWTSAIRNTLAVPNLKYMCIYNWWGIKENENALSAIKQLTK